ncbi:group 1 glycosyl transferase [Calothrix sp. NIES-4101]|nr:group 1 glycosyl transferase [Calothrix sp. NIES-4101]
MKTIAIYHPYFTGGGAETVSLWILQALQNKYDLTLFTIGDVDFTKLNSMYGTNLSGKYIKVITLVPGFLKKLCYFAIANNKSIQMIFLHLLIRLFKANSHKYDLRISTYNAMDLGQPGIQYIHMIKVLEGKAFHRKISNFIESQISQNISVVNSWHIAKVVKEVYNIEPKIVYPPVVIDIPNFTWNLKENAFICSGRLVEAKEPHRIIKILKSVREQGFNIKLYMTGGGGGVYGWRYNRLIKKLVSENSSWINLYENLPYKEYTELLARCRYGIHYKKEPFGISIAEMVKAGAIPFVRSEGGQVEIVGKHNTELFFNNEEEAVKVIVDVLSNTDKQKQIIHSLDEQKSLFSTQRFMSEFNTVVDAYFDTKV